MPLDETQIKLSISYKNEAIRKPPLKDVRDRSAIMVWEVKFGGKILPVYSPLKPGFHLQQAPRPRHKKQSDYVVEQSSFSQIALFWLKIGRCRGRNWVNGNQNLA